MSSDISQKNRQRRFDFFKYKSWDSVKWKLIIWSDECRFKLFHSDGRIKVSGNCEMGRWICNGVGMFLL